MAGTIAEKIIRNHLVSGKMTAGEDVTIKLDHVLLQDATGTMAWLEYEALGVPKVKPFSTQYIDHNLLQEDNKNMDDHLFLMTIASKFGGQVSLPGNGISHHVHKERFTKPGMTLIGSDSHTPTSGGSGMLAIGVGGMDAAIGMATGEYTFAMPEVVGIELTGKLKPWCTAKDAILELLQRVDVDGGKGKIWEFYGQGVKTLDVSERSTIGNMGAETGATTTLFPSDELTKKWFTSQKRGNDYNPLQANKKAEYADVIEIDLGKVEPMISLPHSPGKVKPVREVAGIDVEQAMIGSSTNSSFQEMMRCAKMVEKAGRSMTTMYHVIPGSRQLLQTMDKYGGVSSLLGAGARISEPSCNACIGMGNAPASNSVSVRSFPRNWEGRSGTEDDQVYLSSPETATACAVKGVITDPRDIGIKFPSIAEPQYVIDDRMILKPKFKNEVRRGPNIKKIEYRRKLADAITAKVTLKLGDDVSTDHIMPAGAKVLPFRSNIPKISEFVFYRVDPEFVARTKAAGKGIIVGGHNYGQGSSREHAAIAPMFLGIQAVLAKSFARIHRSNLINFGILPLVITDKMHRDIKQGDTLVLKNVKTSVKKGDPIAVINKRSGKTVRLEHNLTPREKAIISKGGLLNFVKARTKKI